MKQRDIIFKNLCKSWDNHTLSHFYILKTTKSSYTTINNFVDEFLEYVYSCEKKTPFDSTEKSIRDIYPADWLFLDKNEKSSNYTLEEFSEFFKFQSFTPLEHKYKLIVVQDSHLMNTTLANKILKTLEEPQKNTIIFFLVPGDFPLLPTIESRAVQLSIPSDEVGLMINTDINNWNNDLIEKIENEEFKFSKKAKTIFLSFLEGKATIAEVIEVIKNSKPDQATVVKLCLFTMTSKGPNFKQLEEQLKNIQWFQEASLYNNSANQRLFSLMESTFS